MNERTDAPPPAGDAALLREATAVEAEFGAPLAPGQGDPAEAPISASAVEEFRGALELVRGLLSPLSPVIERIWTDDVLDRVAPASVRVADKYGISLGVGAWGPEIMLLAAVGPPTVATWRALQDEADQRRRAAAATDRASRSIPSAPPPIGDGPQG